LVKTVKAVESGRYTENPQEQLTGGMDLKHAPKIFKEDCNIKWDQPAEKIYNFIRGLSPYPTAYTTLNDKILKVFGAEYELATSSEEPGEFFSDNRTFLKVSATNGFIHLTDVQLEGKKRMGIEEFLRGVRL